MELLRHEPDLLLQPLEECQHLGGLGCMLNNGAGLRAMAELHQCHVPAAPERHPTAARNAST